MTVQERPYMERPETDPGNLSLQETRSSGVSDGKKCGECQKAKKRERELLDRIKAIETRLAELHVANLERPPIKELTAALQLLMVVASTLPIREDVKDENRRRLVGAFELAQEALLKSGAACKLPAARIAWEHALREYTRLNAERRGE